MNSIYGNSLIPGGIGDLYFYDRTYTADNFTNKEELAQTDNVFVGRYVLVQAGETNGGHNEAWRKVIKNGKFDYERVAVLDGATPSIRIGDNLTYGKDYFDPKKKVYDETTSSAVNTIEIEKDGAYTDDGTYAMKLNINLPILGESVGQVYNVLYGSADLRKRSDNVDAAPQNLANIAIGDKTLKNDGLLGVLGAIQWDKIDTSRSGWANTYLGLDSEPAASQRLAKEYLKLNGESTMQDAAPINWYGSSIAGDGKGNLNITAQKINANGAITANKIYSTSVSGALDETQNVPYKYLQRVVSKSGQPYVLTNSSQYEKNAQSGAVTLVDTDLQKLPAGTIFFIPVES